MFPIPFNFPFRKANGDISTIGAEINAGGGGSSYTLPTASANVKGGVKIGAGLTMEGEVLKNTNPTPATPYTLPTASAETLGGVKVGNNLSIDENGVLSASGGGGNTETWDSLWEAPDETAKISMGYGTKTLTTTAGATYKKFIVRYREQGQNGADSFFTVDAPNGIFAGIVRFCLFTCNFPTGDNGNFYGRHCELTLSGSTKSIKFDSCYKSGDGSATKDLYLVPNAVFGLRA